MLKAQSTHLPTNPGVYLFKDAAGRVLYVGKAKNLRNRLLSYFRKQEGLSPKTRAMLTHAESLETMVTVTEKEALLLEAGLIKKYKPRYNIILRDDKDYVLFRLNSAAPFPRLEVVRRLRPGKESTGVLLFGPYSSAGDARETWRAIHKVFPLRRCSDRAFANRARPCLYHHMGQCLGPCVLPVDPAVYAAMVRQVALLLQGRSGELLRLLRDEMEAAAERLDFEQAAVLRDRIAAVKNTVERQAVVLEAAQDMDVLGIAAVGDGLALGILFVRGGVLLDKRAYFWPELGLDDAPELLESFLVQFYQAGLPVPSRILAPWLAAPDLAQPTQAGAPPLHPARGLGPLDPTTPESRGASLRNSEVQGALPPAGKRGSAPLSPDAAAEPLLAPDALAAVLAELRGGPVHITGPRGSAEDDLISMAAANAVAARKRAESDPPGARLAAVLGFSRPIGRIEAVDVSHTGGTAARVGMVVFEDERSLKNAYRTYSLDKEAPAVTAGDDFAALYHWAKRRAASGPPWPDLLLVDGGRGQIAAVARAFQEAGCNMGADGDFCIAGIAKARTEDGRADRRAGNDADRIFVPGRSNPLPFAPGSPELFYLQHIRDTVHDFALSRHRRARTGQAMAGELLRLPGVGPKIARILWDRFGSLAAMASTDEAALAAIPGIGTKRAATLIGHLRRLGAARS